MGLLIVLVLLIALDVAVSLCGHDSRDGRDWKRTPTGEAWPDGRAGCGTEAYSSVG